MPVFSGSQQTQFGVGGGVRPSGAFSGKTQSVLNTVVEGASAPEQGNLSNMSMMGTKRFKSRIMTRR